MSQQHQQQNDQTHDTVPLKKVKKEILSRTILWYVTFFGFAVDQMIRININIGIVDMISLDNVTDQSLMKNRTHARVSAERSVMDALVVSFTESNVPIL